MQASTRSLVMLFAALSILIGIVFVTLSRPNVAFGSAPSGLPGTVATTSVNQVTPNSANISNLVFATSTCAARVVTSVASALMLTFSDAKGFGPTGTQGIIQAASTTAVYDGGLYGCGAVRIYSFSTSSITVMETQ